MTIVYSALDLMAALLSRRAGVRGILFWAVGSGDQAWDQALPTEDPRTTRLVNEIYRKPIDPSHIVYHPQTHQLEITVTFAIDEAAGTWREHGLFGGNATPTRSSGYLINYRVHAPIDKTTPRAVNQTERLTLGQLYRAFDLVGGLLANDQQLKGITYWAVGSGDPTWDQTPPTPDSSRTRLVNEIFRKPLDPTSQIGYQAETRTLDVRVHFDAEEAPAVLREFGIFGGDATQAANSGYLVNYQAHAAIDKTFPRALDRTLRFTLGSTPNITVPPLIGQTEASARLAIDQAGLLMGAISRIESDAAGGSVIAQSPIAGTIVASGVAVGLTVSTPIRVGVPDLARLSPASAAQALASAGLRLADPPTPTAESDAPAGTIVLQSPAAGARAARGSAVSVTLAIARSIALPDVVGLPIDDAAAHLQTIGLRFTANPSATQERADKEPGSVVAQTPAAGSRAPVGSIVQLATAVAPTAIVPSVIAATPKDAVTQLQAANLNLGAVTYEESASPAGTIIRQLPPAGSRAPSGGTIAVVASLSVTALVPDLHGLTLAATTDALTSVQLQLAPSPDHRASTLTPETVIDQAPDPGVRAPRGTPVKIVLAAPAQVVVPRLVNIPLELARELVSSASLRVTEPPVEHQTDQVAPGSVLAQDPAADTSVAIGAAITLTVAVPVRVTVPDLAGLTQADATQTLGNLGLTLDPTAPTRESDATPGTIIEQTPAAATSVLLNTVVHIVVATPRTALIPSVIGLTTSDAGARLTALGLTLAVTARVISTQPPGTIVQQSPPPGQRVQVGTAVNVGTARAAVVVTAALGPEPDTLFFPATSMLSAHHVLKALYDGPFDEQKFTYQPAIFDAPPDVQTQQVSVAVGQAIVVAGRLTVFTPSTSVVTLPQMRVTFHLRKDLRWDDGTPLTSTDSTFAFELASNATMPASRFRVARTAGYRAIDDFTITWFGLPGWTDASVERNFWTPLPRRALAGQTVPALLSGVFGRRPLSYGPFRVAEWQPGDHITLERHPAYFRAPEDLPRLDQLVLRVGSRADAVLNQVVAGNLDLTLTGSLGGDAVGALRRVVNTVNTQLVDGNTQTYLMFGTATAQGPSRFFANALVRQAFGFAIDRQRIITEILGGNAAVADSLVPPSHPAHVTGMSFGFDPVRARQLLAQAGWTPLPSGGGLGQGGQPFAVTLVFADYDPNRAKMADLIASMLGQLGIRVTPRAIAASALYARGRAAPLYGRQFDMALFDWTAGIEPPAELFLSEEVSGDPNAWGGPNVSGYASPEFDGMALSALSTPDAASRQAFWGRAQVLFGRDVPALPLFGQVRVAAMRRNLTGFALDPSQESEMWNAEQFTLG